MEIILASQSARRRDILKNLGVEFRVVVSEVDETVEGDASPETFVETVSCRKALAVRDKLRREESGYSESDTMIIASDTVVECDGVILGKPKNRTDAAAMMRMLSGRRHRVLSGIAVIYRGKTVSSHDETAVEFRALSESDIEAYVSTDEPYDKAGGYGIQDKASVFVRGINGDYLNGVGLPVFTLFDLLKRVYGIEAFEIIG